MNVDRRIRCVEGEYDDEVTPERDVWRQNVVGRCNGGGGFNSSFLSWPYPNDHVLVADVGVFHVVMLLLVRCLVNCDVVVPVDKGEFGGDSFSSWKAVLNGGALRDRVGRCRVLGYRVVRDGKGSGDGTLVLCCITESSEGGALDAEEHEDTDVVSNDTLVEVDVDADVEDD